MSLSTLIPNYKVREEAETKLVAFVGRYLRGHGKRYAIFQDVNSDPHDPWLQELLHEGSRFFTFKDEVYHFLESQDRRIREVASTIHRGYTANQLLNSGVLTDLIDVPDIQSGQEINEETLRNLASNVSHVIVQAFDSEQHLIWSNR